MATKSSTATLQAKIDKLTAENKQLRAQNAQYRKPVKKTMPKTTRRFWTKLAVILAIGFAGAILVVGNMLFWAGRAVVDNDRYMNTVGPLIQQPAVQEAVASYATDQLFQNVDVEQFTADALPPRVSFLAPALNTQIKTYTQKTIQTLLGNEKFQTVWTNTMQTAHSKIINYARNYEGDGTISLADMYTQISSQLTDTKLSFLADKPLPAKVGSITIVQASWLPVLHDVIVHINLWQNLAILAVLLLTVGAVMLTKDRRRNVIRVGIIYAVLMAFSLLTFQIAQTIIAGKVNPAYQQAVTESTKIVLKPLRIQTFTIMLVSILTAVIAWVTGPYAGSKQLRKWVDDVLAGRLHKKIFKHENAVTTWVGSYKRVMQWIVVGIAAAMVIFIHHQTPLTVLGAALVTLLIALIFEVVGQPQ